MQRNYEFRGYELRGRNFLLLDYFLHYSLIAFTKIVPLRYDICPTLLLLILLTYTAVSALLSTNRSSTDQRARVKSEVKTTLSSFDLCVQLFVCSLNVTFPSRGGSREPDFPFLKHFDYSLPAVAPRIRKRTT